MAADVSVALYGGVSLIHPARIHGGRDPSLTFYVFRYHVPFLFLHLAPSRSVYPLQGSIHRYFECVGGGSGSFLKPGKFSVGSSMAEALRQQYVDMNAPLLAPENLLPDAYASTSKGGKKVRIQLYVSGLLWHRKNCRHRR